MKKRVLALTLALTLMIALAIPAMGATTGPAAKIDKKLAVYSSETSIITFNAGFLTGGTADGYEYRKTGMATFTSVYADGMELDVTPWKQDYEFRAVGGTKVAKFTIAAQPAAPAVKVDTAKGQIKVKSGWTIGYEDDVTGNDVTVKIGTAKVLEIGTSTSLLVGTNGEVTGGTLAYNGSFEFGNVGKGDGKKPISSTVTVNPDTYVYDYYGYENPTIAFGKDAKGKWIPVGGAAIEMWDVSKNKWAKAKLTGTPTGLYRIAGTKSYLPSVGTTDVDTTGVPPATAAEEIQKITVAAIGTIPYTNQADWEAAVLAQAQSLVDPAFTVIATTLSFTAPTGVAGSATIQFSVEKGSDWAIGDPLTFAVNW